MENKLSAVKMTLASLVLATAISSVTGCNSGRYQSQARAIERRISSNQNLSDKEKEELKLTFRTLYQTDLSKEEKAYLKKPLEKKRKDVYNNLSQENLDFYHNLGLIDKYNLSDVECLSLLRAKGIVTSLPFK